MSQPDGVVVRGGAQWFAQEITADPDPTSCCSPRLTAEQRARLLEVGERCPVHRPLKSEIIIRTTAQPSAE